jgi:flagellar hook-associated protein FlgK
MHLTSLNSTSSIALSGMNVAAMQQRVAAHNIANENTEGFHRQQLQQQTQAEGGVTAQVTQASEPGTALERDLVQQRVALYTFKASLQVVQTQDEMLGSLLDIRA